MKAAVIIALLGLAACSSGPPRPVDLDASDMCSRCRMAISQNRYAAELLDRDGGALKFDDIGCMVRYAADHHLDTKVQTAFVMDYQTQHWLAGPQASFVRSAAIPSPMSGGLAAFQDRAQAQQFAATVNGRVLGFEELWTSKP